MIVFAKCISDTVKIPGTESIIMKADLGWVVVFVDLFVIIAFLIFTNVLENS